MKKYGFLFLSLVLLVAACTDEDALSEKERTESYFSEELGCQINTQQMWKTAVKVQVNVTTSSFTKIWLVSDPHNGMLYDYREVSSSGIVNMTVPQGQVDTVYLCAVSNEVLLTHELVLSGKPVETVSINASDGKTDVSPKLASLPVKTNLVFSNKHGKTDAKSRPISLCGNSVGGNGIHYQLSPSELATFYTMMGVLHLSDGYVNESIVTNYELVSKGPFYITWANGWERLQTSHILGYYYHSPGTYSDIVYVDLSETHKWDYIDGLSKIQYQIDIEDSVDGIRFYPNQWYDANFDMKDAYGSTYSENMDRIGDSAYCMKDVYDRYGSHISALRGLSFLVDVPVGMHLGFYLRSDEELFPTQWDHIVEKGVTPREPYRTNHKGTCFSAQALNVDGKHRSAIWDAGAAKWLGMEDYVIGGDNDCDDVVFCITADMGIYIPDVITPDLDILALYDSVMPWTLAFEDPYREADFDFNDVVIQLEPNYNDGTCCVTLMAAGSSERMYLYYDGPNGLVNMGEVHDLLGSNNLVPINTNQSVVFSQPVQLDCVPWPAGYTMDNDAKRFYVEVKRGTCADCSETLSLPSDPGLLPEAVLVAGKWNWPTEGTSITTVYPSFRAWCRDPSQVSCWKWYKQPATTNYVSY